MKIKNYLIYSIKGFVIGMAIILPGISGGSVAALLGIYDKMIGAIADIRKHFKESMKVLLPILLGLIFSVSLFIPLDLIVEIAPFPVIALFVGMMIGGVPELTKKLKGKANPRNLILALAGFLFSASIGVVSVFALSPADLSDPHIFDFLKLFAVGFGASTTLATPGISGSITLLALGYYLPLLNVAAEMMALQNLGINLLICLAFGIGMLTGFIVLSKIMKFLLTKYLIPTSFTIVGVVCGSFISSFFNSETVNLVTTNPDYLSPLQISLTAILLILGVLSTLFLTRLANKKMMKATTEEQK